MSKRLITTVFLLLLLSANVAAASRLLNYENRVVRAAEQVERIKADRDYGEEGVTYIRRLLPRAEEIDFEGRTITVDNTWLYVMLDSYDAERDPQQKTAKLNEVVGRLRSLDDHLRRAEVAPSESGDANERIREILSRRDYRPEPESPIAGFVRKIRQKIGEFLGRIFYALNRLLEKLIGTGSGNGWVGYVVLGLVLLLGAVTLVRLGRKIRRPQGRRKKTRLVLGEEIAMGTTSKDLADAAMAAARAGDYRTAIRKLYVSLLYELAERRLIELEESTTNNEYLRKAAGFVGLAPPMKYLTDRFDYVWYGMFASSQDDFAAYLASYLEAMENAKALGEAA